MKNIIYIVIIVVFGLKLNAQGDALLKQLPKNADMVVRLSPEALAEMGRQDWSLSVAKQLKTDILGKADPAFLRDILFYGLDSVGIGLGDHYWVGERKADGITIYSYFLPMANMGKWLAYVQKTLSLYNNSDIRMSPKAMIYVHREQTLIGWTREYVRITTFVLPNQGQYAPTYVQQKTYISEQLLPSFNLPLSGTLATDTAWAQHCTPNSLLAFRLKYKENTAYGQVTDTKNTLNLAWYQAQNIALQTNLQTWANWLNVKSFALDLQKVAALAPNRAPYTQISTTLQQLPKLQIELQNSQNTNFTLPVSWAQLLRAWPK
jgi:hypothetical protein